MSDLSAIREALAENLRSIPGVQVNPFKMASPTPPCLQVLPGEMSFDLAMGRGLDKIGLVIEAIVSYTEDIGAQKRLDRFMAGSGEDSVKEAVEQDRTLGGLADDLRVVRAYDYGEYALEGRGAVLGVRFEVEVYASGL